IVPNTTKYRTTESETDGDENVRRTVGNASVSAMQKQIRENNANGVAYKNVRRSVTSRRRDSGISGNEIRKGISRLERGVCSNNPGGILRMIAIIDAADSGSFAR